MARATRGHFLSMPIILTQYSHDAADLHRYLDREGLIYHFPSRYLPVFDRSINELGDRRFLYQRPVRGAPPGQSGTYFGYGLLGDPYPEAGSRDMYWVEVRNYHAMRTPIPLRDGTGSYYETGNADRINFQGRSVRWVPAERFNQILALEGAYSLGDGRDLQDTGLYAPIAAAPLDAFRPMDVVPPGTGYIPRGSGAPDPYDAAALQERARADHQATLALFVAAIRSRGGRCLYNNNVDLFAEIGERRLLVEAKSLTRQHVAVDRMRYGMGQLMDYSIRYRAELRGAEPVLAFGAQPERETSWIPTILQGNNIAFIANHRGQLVAGNELGEALPIF